MRCFTNSANSTNSTNSTNLYSYGLIVFLPIGVVGNSAVIIYNIFLNHEKTPSSWLVTNLAVADLLVCLAVYPAKILSLFYDQQTKNNEYLKNFHLKITYFASIFLSIIFLLVITIDKYLCIAKPLKYPMIVTKRRIFILISCIWSVALVQPATIYTYYLFETNSRKKCQMLKAVVYLLILYTLVPIGVIAILNYKLFKIVKEQRQRLIVLQQLPHEESEQVRSEQNQTWLRRLATELKAVKTFAIIVGILIFCFVPHTVVNLMKIVTKLNPVQKEILHVIYPISKELVAMNSIVNAYIYALRHRKYRKAYKQLLVSAWARLFHARRKTNLLACIIFHNNDHDQQ